MLRKLEFKRTHKLRMICKVRGIDFMRQRRSFRNCIRSQVVNKKLPNNFSVLNNFQEVFSFVSEVLDKHTNRKWKQINLDLTGVDQMDSVGSCLLLSVIKELGNLGIKVSGNLPKNDNCARILVESGFLNHMKDERGKEFKVSTFNMIVETGTDKTKNERIGRVIRRSMGLLLGCEQRYQPAYTIAMEICSNSVEHAYQKRAKHWILGVYYKDDCVAFTMVDTGVGILSTLKRKFWKEITDKLAFRSNGEILYRAFQRKYGSSTLQVNRNKGLPCVLDKFNLGLIQNLKVITNDVYLDFNQANVSIEMNNPFSGVLFYWEVNKDCVDKFLTNNK